MRFRWCPKNIQGDLNQRFQSKPNVAFCNSNVLELKQCHNESEIGNGASRRSLMGILSCQGKLFTFFSVVVSFYLENIVSKLRRDLRALDNVR